MTHRLQHGDDTIRNHLFKLAIQVGPILDLRRHRLTIYKSAYCTDIYKHHFVNRVVDHWNSLPFQLLDTVQFHLFKKRLKVYLLSKYNPYEF